MALLAVPAVPVLAAEDVGSGRRVQSVTRTEAVPVGDVEGHVQGVVAFGGLTFFASGEIATHTNVATFDLTDGSGTHAGYVVHRFEDGATALERYEGRAEAKDGGATTLVEGSFECTGGTGRFAGLAGKGTYRGERLGALDQGSWTYIDFTGDCAVR
jgi:hypothetical protein